MNPQDLDTLIDAAARQMVSREPSRSLTCDVMARLRDRGEPSPRRFVWAACTVGVICAVVALVMMNRTPTPATQTQRMQAPPRVASVEPPIPSTPAVEPVRPRAMPRQAIQRPRATLQVPLMEEPIAPAVAPLATEPIVLSELDLPPLESETATIEDITIHDITIEPLSASND